MAPLGFLEVPEVPDIWNTLRGRTRFTWGEMGIVSSLKIVSKRNETIFKPF